MIFRDISPPDKKSKNAVFLKPQKQQTKQTAGAFFKKNPKKKEPKEIKLLIKRREGKTARELTYMAVLAIFILLVFNFINLSNSGPKFKQKFLREASAGFENIMNAAANLKNTDFENAKNLFKQANSSFENMRADAWFSYSAPLPTINMQDPVFETANSIISAGKYLSSAGVLFSDISKEIQYLPKFFFEANAQNLLVRPSLTENLKSQLPNIIASAKDLNLATDEIKKVPASFIPSSLRERFEFAKNALSALSDFLNSFQADIPAILTLLGDKEPHTYLILLQNNSELRPTGGFIGNYAIIETNDGYISKNNISDVYSADHQLAEIIPPPAEILPANSRWYMRDSNYSAHFPLSAEKAAWFLEQENGPGVDTVIAIDQTFIADLMRLTGGIKLPELPQYLTHENFARVLSYIIESKISGSEDPKAILKSFMPAFQQALFQNVEPAEIIPVLKSAIQEKHLYAYSKIPDVQAFFSRRGLTGEMRQLEPKDDYLNIAHTSIAGNKSDDYIKENVAHDTYIESDGSVVDEIKITRSHQWTFETERALKEVIASFGFDRISKETMKILGKSPNVHKLRIYVPLGSIIEESSDPSVNAYDDKETGKTYFSARMDVPVGKTASLRIRYRLPFKLNLDPVDKYVLYAQKQAGQKNITIVKRLLPESRVMNYKYFPAAGSFDMDGVWSYETEFNRDMSFSSVWGK